MRLPIALALSLCLGACRTEPTDVGMLHADPGRVDLAAARILEDGPASPVTVANVGTECVGLVTSSIDSDRIWIQLPDLPHIIEAGGVEHFEVRPDRLPIPAGLDDAVIVLQAVIGERLEGACVLPEEDRAYVDLKIPVVLATPLACDADADGVFLPACGGLDCDDADAAVFPGAEEICNGKDDDCDEVVDGPEATGAVEWYADLDGDGFGDASLARTECLAPEGFVADDTDCDDADGDVHPGAHETCDGVDQDCDGDIDEGYPRFDFHPDADGDTYGDPDVTIRACLVPEGTTPNDDDCDDAAASIHPGAPELCDGIDQDCDGTPDDNPVNAPRWWLDTDGDSYGNPAIYVNECVKPGGYAGNLRDCNDNDATIHPNVPETCDGVDEDCDGAIDDDPIDGDPWYPDGDLDGFGDEAGVVTSCEPIEGYLEDGGDCDDADPDINPDATEVCDAVDQDCDGLIDQGQNVCGCPIAHFGDHAYGFCNVALTWQFAGFACSFSGYDLVRIDDAAEDAFVTSTARSYNTNPWWTGYSDGATEGTWLWSDGTPGTYTNWAPGRPLTGNNTADCMQIGSTAGWVDSSCGNFDLRRFVCEAGP